MDDFLVMLEKAQTIYSLLKEVNGGVNDNNNLKAGVDFEKMAALMDIINILKSGEPYRKAEAQHAYPAFEAQMEYPALERVKSSISRLEPQYQRYMAMGVKLVEMQKMMEKYLAYTEIIKKKAGKNWHREVLVSVRPLVDRQSVSIVDNLLKFLELKEAMERAGLVKGGEGFGF